MLSLKSYQEAVEFARTALDLSVRQGKEPTPGRFQTSGGGFLGRPLWLCFQETI